MQPYGSQGFYGQRKWGNGQGVPLSNGLGGRGGGGGGQRLGSLSTAPYGANGNGNGTYRPPPQQQQQQQQQQQKKKGFEIGPGLHNLGNTCYLNSVLQVLFHAPLLFEAIQASPHIEECERRQRGVYCLLCKMELITRKIREGHHSSNSPKATAYSSYSYSSYSYGSSNAISPEFLTKHLRFLSPHLVLGRQEDAAELLRLLRDKLQYCWTGKDDPAFKARPVDARPYPFALFGGMLQSIVKCLHCERQSFATDPMEDLVLEIVHGGQPLSSLKDALTQFTTVETLNGANQYRCDHCKHLRDAKRRFMLGRVPPLLCIQLKRFSFFSHFGSKLSHPVSYPLRIDLTQYCSKKQLGLRNLKAVEAELFGVIVHQGGTLDSGHYFALVKSPTTGRWFECNDSRVRPVAEREALEQQRGAYMLFYRSHFTEAAPPQPTPDGSSAKTTLKRPLPEGQEEEGGKEENGRKGKVLIGPQLPPGMVLPPPPATAEEEQGGTRPPLSPPPPSAPLPLPRISLGQMEARALELLRSDATALQAVAAAGKDTGRVAATDGVERAVETALLSLGEGGILGDPERLEQLFLAADETGNGHAINGHGNGHHREEEEAEGEAAPPPLAPPA